VRAVIIGPGKVGCGYLAPLLLNSGWEVVLAARTAMTADRIRSAGRFNVRVAGGGVQDVGPVRAVITGTPEFDLAVAEADLLLTSVGVDKVTRLAPAVAQALGERDPERPIDLWVVENQNCAPELEAAVRTHAGREGSSLPHVGFSGGVAGVAVAHGGWVPGRPTEFVRDDVETLDLDATRLLCDTPRLPGVRRVRDYLASLHEKLFVFNAGHAISAYLGSLRAHHTIDEAVADPLLRPLIVGCLIESKRALLRLHNGSGDDVAGAVSATVRRFSNTALADPIPRVARDPIRKLSPGERLLGPATLIQHTSGRVPAHLALGVAGALLYRSDEDGQSARLAGMLRTEGVAHVLREVCSLDPQSDFGRAVMTCYHGFILREEGAIFPRVGATVRLPQTNARRRREPEAVMERRAGGRS
jgi:mannitol-1-phosphate 5-dehydrogenase